MLENLKLLLGICDSDRDNLLMLIINNTTSRLRLLLGGIEPPEELCHIILDVSVIRFNKIGSEGLSGHTVEGETQSFADSDFSGYMDEIQAWIALQEDTPAKKVVRFL